MTIAPSSPEKVLIIGCGDIGQRLSQILAQEHYVVTGLRRSPPADLAYLRYKLCDVTRITELGRELADNYPIIVISMTPAERSDAGYERAYVQTCHNLVNQLDELRLQPRLLVFVSSTSVYGQNDGSHIDENSPTEPESFSGKRLLEAERIIQHSGYPSTVVRFSGIYGPGRYRLIDQVRQKRASASTHITNRIHADDCAGVLAHLIDLHRTRQTLASLYLATDSNPVSLIEVNEWLATQLGITDFLSDDASNERGNKWINNQRLLATGYQLRYPGFKEGYTQLLRDTH